MFSLLSLPEWEWTAHNAVRSGLLLKCGLVTLYTQSPCQKPLHRMESKPHAKPAPAALVKAITAPGRVLPTSKGAPTDPLGAWGAAALSLVCVLPPQIPTTS